jgi:peptide/nickel transport system ATP-binding protein
VVEHISTRVAVMYLGTLCELAGKADLYGDPRIPIPAPCSRPFPSLGQGCTKHIRLKGEVPTPINLPTGCVFHGRCNHADHRCVEEIPKATLLNADALVACHRVEEGKL